MSMADVIVLEDIVKQFTMGDTILQALDHVNFSVEEGDFVAIMGPSGSGKSTIINLIPRLYDVWGGVVTIGRIDVRDMDLTYLRGQIGMVTQDTYLFNGTIRENLLYGNPNATEEEIDRALKLVSADQVVAKMEKGIDTDVGEGGDLLSTGEKQLISFARAILADPRILVLDEATASVDTLTEQKIQSAIDTVIEITGATL